MPQPRPSVATRAPAGGHQPSFAIVGSGPAGCYTAQCLRKAWPDAQIAVFERLPVPYGLIRYGVAADHQGTKAVTRQFDRLFEREGVNFVGNLTVGRDIELSTLQELFDIVVLATGLSTDRVLAVPGAELPGVHAAGPLTRYLNSYPDSAPPSGLGPRVAVIGQGNVAVDLVRILAKSPPDFAGSDLSDTVLATLAAAGIRHISVVGRSGPAEAKFDPAMIRELAKIPGVTYRILDNSGKSAGRVNEPPAHPARLAALQELTAQSAPTGTRLTVDFHFGWYPQRLEGADRVAAARFEDSDGHTLRIEADCVLTAIGVAPGPDEPRPAGHPGLYRVGWARRGGRGAIPDARQDARAAAEQISQDLRAGARTRRRPGLGGISGDILRRSVAFSGWQRIDTAELSAAGPRRIRSKIATTIGLLDVAAAGPTHSSHLEGALQ